VNKYPRLLILGYSLGPISIILMHIGCLLPFWTGLSWNAVFYGVILYLVRMLAITAIYHRLIIHKSYQAPAIIKWVGSLIAASSGQMGPNWWKGHHQEHHQNSDQIGDIHSPNKPNQGIKGFLWAQGGWIWTSRFWPNKLPADVESDWGLKLIDRFHFVPLILLGLISYGIGGLDFLGAFFLSTTILFHGAATANSLAHLFGTQPFDSKDQSRNNWFVALIGLGEGWHNLHHTFQWSARHGFSLKDGKVIYLPDPTYWFILLLEKLNLASNLKLPSETELLEAAMIKPEKSLVTH